jgi:hypothetical protein
MKSYKLLARMKLISLLLTAVLCSELSSGQAPGINPEAGPHPEIFWVDKVTVGTNRILTLAFSATGKWWPDTDSIDPKASAQTGPLSAEIRCFKDFAFCERVGAVVAVGPPMTVVVVEDFDILRWNDKEIIAVDNEETCDVLTLRVEIPTKRVSLDRVPKGSVCPGEIASTSFLENHKETFEREWNKRKELATQEKARKK